MPSTAACPEQAFAQESGELFIEQSLRPRHAPDEAAERRPPANAPAGRRADSDEPRPRVLPAGQAA